MTNQTMSQSRLSYSYVYPALRNGNILALGVTRITVQFDKARDPLRVAQHTDMRFTEAERRDRAVFKATRRTQASEMIKRHNPHPELKPSPKLARDVDAQAFNQNWRIEQRRARRTNLIAEGRAMVSELRTHKTYLAQEWRGIDQFHGNKKDKNREAFKALRRVETSTANIASKAQGVKHKLTDF